MGLARMLPSADGVHLAVERWSPVRDARAHVVFVHGLGEHRRARPYPKFYDALTASGFDVLAFDLRGHGQSDGPRLYARDLSVFDQDIARLVGMAADEGDGRPVFVIGGSLGGLIAIGASFEPHDCLAGIVAGAPALDGGGASPWMRRVARLLRLVAPRMRLDIGFDLAGLAHDEREVARYLDDPLMQIGRITPAMAGVVRSGIERAMRRADDVTLPMLMLHGLADRVVPPDGTIALHAMAGSRDKTLKTYPDAFHHLLVDDVRSEVTRDVIAWLGARTTAPA